MIRFVISCLLFLVSTLTIIKAPTNSLWKLSIIAIEWGHYLALLTLTLAIISAKAAHNKLSVVISIVATLFFLRPLTSAMLMREKLVKDINSAFPVPLNTVKRTQALNLKDLFFGIDYEKQKYSTITYKPALTLDLYKTKVPSPCVLVIHGGGWDSGDSQQLADLNSYLAENGYAVASMNYRLAPQYKYESQIEDVRDAISYLKHNGIELGIDTNQLILLGRSAGGQLALQAAYIFRDTSIKGVVAFYAPADMVWGYSVPGNPWIMDSRLVLCNYLGVGCDVDSLKYVEASPVNHISASVPPTLLLHGQPDVLVAFEHSRRLNERLNKAGVKHYLVNFSWATHGYDFNFSGPTSQMSLFSIMHFLGNVTSVPAK